MVNTVFKKKNDKLKKKNWNDESCPQKRLQAFNKKKKKTNTI